MEVCLLTIWWFRFCFCVLGDSLWLIGLYEFCLYSVRYICNNDKEHCRVVVYYYFVVVV